jgi:hypothetical protein
MHRDPDIVTLERFVFRLSALSSDDWSRLATQVAPLRGDAIDAVWRRAELEALADPAIARWARIPAQVAGVAAALLDELSPGSLAVAPSISVHDVRRPGGRRYLELLADAHDLVAANAPGDEGTAAAVVAAALGLAGRSGDADERLVRAYRYVEPVIPLSTVLSPPEAPPSEPSDAPV